MKAQASLAVGFVGIFSCVDRGVYTGEPKGIQPAVARATEEQLPSNVMNWLFIVDDSVSMADKQAVLAASIDPELVKACAPAHERRVRLLPPNLPNPGTSVSLFCDYGD